MIQEYSQYPTRDAVRMMMDLNFDAIIIELDSNPALALELVETICSIDRTTVMVFTGQTNASQMIRCMWAGAREFLTEPSTDNSWAEALERTSTRQPASRMSRRAAGKLYVFFGAKGGCGVTTIASNFAVLMGRESGKRALLVDLDLPFGNVALALGVPSQYSAVDALQNANRLDSRMLSSLLTQYSPNLSVLGAPGKFVKMEMSNQAVDKLVSLAREEFDYVVVDSGSRLDLGDTNLFKAADKVYLVSQVSVPDLRNSNRLVSEFFGKEGPKLEIVLNRYAASTTQFDADQITRALTMPARWKIPEGDRITAIAENSMTPLVLDDTPISRVIRQMARSACGLPESPDKRKKFIGLF
jgi:pilus assembly protein CpaE